jgi:NAD(P)-dependent dehydrogenase (short-subunit alcohol dehydrogenase family)
MNVKEMFNLEGNLAIITGGAKGLGLQMAEGLCEMGADVILADITEVSNDALSRVSKNSSSFNVDVVNYNQVNSLMEFAINKYGKIDILINNAGISENQNTEKVTYGEWMRVLDTNIWGTFNCSRCVFPFMKKNNYGKIINIASLYSVLGWNKSLYVEDIDKPFDHFSYTASKGAVASLTRDLAVRWARFGINVNSISPGGFVTEQTKSMLSDYMLENFTKRTPKGRFGGEDDLKGAVVFLASKASNFVTGVNLFIDGGFTAW